MKCVFQRCRRGFIFFRCLFPWSRERIILFKRACMNPVFVPMNPVFGAKAGFITPGIRIPSPGGKGCLQAVFQQAGQVLQVLVFQLHVIVEAVVEGAYFYKILDHGYAPRLQGFVEQRKVILFPEQVFVRFQRLFQREGLLVESEQLVLCPGCRIIVFQAGIKDFRLGLPYVVAVGKEREADTDQEAAEAFATCGGIELLAYFQAGKVAGPAGAQGLPGYGLLAPQSFQAGVEGDNFAVKLFEGG